MPEPFKPLETTFEVDEVGGGTDWLRAEHNGAWDCCEVAEGDGPRIVAWMAKRTVEKVAWLEHRAEVIDVLRTVAAYYQCRKEAGYCLHCACEDVLAAAVPEETTDESEVGGE